VIRSPANAGLQVSIWCASHHPARAGLQVLGGGPALRIRVRHGRASIHLMYSRLFTCPSKSISSFVTRSHGEDGNHQWLRPCSCSLIHSRSLIFAIRNGWQAASGAVTGPSLCADYRIRTLTRNANEGARRAVDHASKRFPSFVSRVQLNAPLVCRRDPVRLRWTGDCS